MSFWVQENVVLNFQNNYLNDIINNDISGIKQILHMHTGELNNIHYTHKEDISSLNITIVSLAFLQGALVILSPPILGL